MKRTTKPRAKKSPSKNHSHNLDWEDKKQFGGILLDRSELPIQITQETLDILLKEKYDPACKLYLFLLKTESFQHTHVVWATNNFIMKGLSWGEEKLQKAKKILIQLGLIEVIKRRDTATRKIKGWFLKINFSVKHRTPGKANDSNFLKATSWVFQDLGFSRCKILDTRNKNKKTLSDPSRGSENVHKKRSALDKDPNKKTYITLSKKLKRIISTHRKINPTSNITNWANHFRLLMNNELKINGTTFDQINSRVNSVLDYYEKNIGDKYVPEAFGAESFRKKFINIEAQMERGSEKSQTKAKTTYDVTMEDRYNFLEQNPDYDKDFDKSPQYDPDEEELDI